MSLYFSDLQYLYDFLPGGYENEKLFVVVGVLLMFDWPVVAVIRFDIV